MVDLLPPVAVGGGGPVRVLVRAAPTGSIHARHRICGVLGHHRAAGSGAHSRDRSRGQWNPRVVRGRRAIDAALRTHQDCVRGLGITPAGRAPDGACLATRDARAVVSGGVARTGAHRRPARPRPDRLAGHHPACPALVRRPAAEGVRQLIARGDGGRRHTGGLRGIPVRSGAVLAGSQRRPPGRRLPGPAGEIRAGQWGCLRRRSGAGHREVELPAQCSQRLHLRDRRRGTRFHRCRRTAGVVRAVRLHRHADRKAIGRPVPASAHGYRDRMGDRSGVYQRGLRDRTATGHRNSAAVDFGRRNINGHNPFHGRINGQRGAPRACRGRSAAGRPGRQDEPPASAATARTVSAHPDRGAA